MLAIFDWASRLQTGGQEDGAVGHGEHENEDCWGSCEEHAGAAGGELHYALWCARGFVCWFSWIFSHEKILTSGCVFVLLRCFAFEEAIQDCSRSRTELWCGLRMGRLGTVSSLCGLQLCIIALAEGDWDCVAVDGSC